MITAPRMNLTVPGKPDFISVFLTATGRMFRIRSSVRSADCEEFTPPQWELPAHVAALGMRFYTGSMFPAPWRNAIFIAEHGSWNRSVPTGYRVTAVRLNESGNAASYDVFAQGWLGSDGTAWGRPVDVLVAPDGALLVSDDRRDAVYRISR